MGVLVYLPFDPDDGLSLDLLLVGVLVYLPFDPDDGLTMLIEQEGAQVCLFGDLDDSVAVGIAQVGVCMNAGASTGCSVGDDKSSLAHTILEAAMKINPAHNAFKMALIMISV